MIISKDKVVSFHYTVSNAAGEVMESSREHRPMDYLHGHNSIIKGLENALEGKSAGDTFRVTVPPAEAYGEKRAANIQRISAKHIPNASKLKPGQILNLQTHQGPVQVTVVKVGRFNIDVDANHPLAGQELTFDVEVVSVRDSTDEERAHGHAHGPDGHHH